MGDDDRAYHFAKKPGKTYVSRSLTFRKTDGSLGAPMRIASKVIDGTDRYAFVKEKGEVLLRRTGGGRQELVAKFFEDGREINVLTIQRFEKSGSPHKISISLVGNEIIELLDFLVNIKTVHFPDAGKLNVEDGQLHTFVLTRDQAKSLLSDNNEEMLIELLQTEITKQDIVALGYRRAQLAKFEKLLNDTAFFDDEMANHAGSAEAVWQDFFEQNHWIFGYGLSFIFTSSLEGKPLEQVVRGFNVDGRGKITDGFLKTRGLISSLCFVEIKTHRAPLIHSAADYRPGVWRPSKELSGAVAQSQVTVQTALQELEERHDPVDAIGNPTGEQIYNILPRSFAVVGSLNEFRTPNGVNEIKLRSFELFRRNLNQPEVITFDELYERSKFIVEHTRLAMHKAETS